MRDDARSPQGPGYPHVISNLVSTRHFHGFTVQRLYEMASIGYWPIMIIYPRKLGFSSRCASLSQAVLAACRTNLTGFFSRSADSSAGPGIYFRAAAGENTHRSVFWRVLAVDQQ